MEKRALKYCFQNKNKQTWLVRVPVLHVLQELLITTLVSMMHNLIYLMMTILTVSTKRLVLPLMQMFITMPVQILLMFMPDYT